MAAGRSAGVLTTGTVCLKLLFNKIEWQISAIRVNAPSIKTNPLVRLWFYISKCQIGALTDFCPIYTAGKNMVNDRATKRYSGTGR